jgi:uncharacterized protein involved in exopolysaccharide biosynthesis
VKSDLKIEYDLKQYIRILKKHFWLLTAIFVIVVTGACIASYKMTPIYRATVLLQIEKKTSHITEIQDVYQMDVRADDYYQTQYTLITSRKVCKKVLEALSSDLWQLYDDSPDPVNALKESINVEPIRDTYLVNVSYDSENKELATKVANAVTDEYVAIMKRKVKTVSEDAENKITKRIPFLRKKLDDSQAILRKFEEEQSALSFQKRRETIYEILSSLNARIAEIEQEYNTPQKLDRGIRWIRPIEL